MNSFTVEVQKQLDAKRRKFKCSLCGQHPLMIEVAGDAGLRAGDKCRRRLGGKLCGGTYKLAKKQGNGKKRK